MKKLDKNKEIVLKYYENDYSNREIAKSFNVHHTTVGNWLKGLGLKSKTYNQKIDKVNEEEAKCSKCGDIKPIGEFQHGRVNSDRVYRFSYCNECRRKQVRLNLNSDINKFLKDKYNRWKLGASNKNIDFDLEFSDITDMYENQKGLCFYTDIEMDWGVGKGKSPNAISLDKVIPENGYVKGNVVLCSNRFNTIKHNLNLEELKKYIPLFYKRLNKCKQLKLN
jgi:predicted GNAT family acetyltransferase